MPEITKEELQQRLLDLHKQRIEAARKFQAVNGAIQIVEELIAALEAKAQE